VEKGDILTLVGGLVLVLVIALVMNPHYLSSLSAPAETEPELVSPAAYLAKNPPSPTPGQTVAPVVVTTPAGPRPDDPPYRIVYTSKPYTYPRFKLPESMSIFGASDIPIRTEESVPFAYITDTRGGLTQYFSVPYPVWVLNTTVIANRTPQYGNFQMVLCYASNGSIIKGDEVLNRGTSHRIVQTSGTDVYLIITTAYIDSFYISLETPRSYYNAFRP
jgi:hypothetical protein